MKKLILLSMASMLFAISCTNNSGTNEIAQNPTVNATAADSAFTSGRYLGGEPVMAEEGASQFMLNYGSHSITVEATSPVLMAATLIDNRTRGTILDKNAEAFSYLANENEGYHFELATHFVEEAMSVAEFKQHLLEKLGAQATSFELISEGDDFIEYRMDDMMYYRGFLLSALPMDQGNDVNGVIIREFIGFGDADRYPNHRQDYVNTFDNNKVYLVAIMPELGVMPIMPE